MDRKSLLQEVNKLVSSGLRKSAIDLINEYLEDYPNDSSVLSALGRIYLLEKKPEQAVKYLQLSLGSRNTGLAAGTLVTSYGFDELDHDDLEYIENSATEDELDYSYESEDVHQFSAISKQSSQADNENQVIELPSQQETEQPNDHVFIQIKIETSVNNVFELDEEDEEEFDPEFIEINSNNTLDNEDYFLPYQSDVFDDPFQKELAELPDLEDEVEEDDVEEAFVSEEEKSIEDEFDWDGVEDFDDIDEPDLVHYLQDHQVKIGGKISRVERAKQIATEVIQAYDWGIQNLGLLQQVFYENGWAAARVAIEHELARGLVPAELELAIFVRSLWTENQQYWISFIHTSKQPGQETRAAYKCMSWREALRIIRVFNNLPSEEEIQLFVDDIYDDWYCSPRLQKQYKAFIRYLKYRTGSVRHTLPANEQFSFIAAYEQDTLIELPREEIKFAQGVDSLKQQGIDLENMLQDLEQRYDVVKPSVIIDEDNFYLMDDSKVASKPKNKSKAVIADEDEAEDLDDEPVTPQPLLKSKPTRFKSLLEDIYCNTQE
ncbi:MAG: hypothetical protein M0R33_17735 [Methylomonas sp.]|jgi:hypothetical protein|uniref:tetratricopeptide repeat protein n=1 Tax=Methylomonas sp. TaxID=418 RepID=UPI0025DAC004|nr:hypothetical protein [Methylomonas sp.]MCK9608289.1 hypothetical protein [Methylomonas sp.]